MLPERSPCSAVLPECSLLGGSILCSRSVLPAPLCSRSILYAPRCFRSVRCAPRAALFPRALGGIRVKICSSNLLRPGALSRLHSFFPSMGTFESPPKCDYMIDVNTRPSPRKQKGWRRRHFFLAARLLIKTFFGKISLALSWETSPLCVLSVSSCA